MVRYARLHYKRVDAGGPIGYVIHPACPEMYKFPICVNYRSIGSPL